MKIAMMIRMISMLKPLNIICFDRRTLTILRRFWQGAFLVGILFCGSFCAVEAAQWSNTSPPINLSHIFEGEINKRGKPVGFHARPMGKDPARAVLVNIISKENKYGVYSARVEILDVKKHVWKRKKFSSFFPDKLSRIAVQSLILKAYAKGRLDPRGKWRGPSDSGFVIEGWLCPKKGSATCPRGAINTAYPVYKKD